MEKKSCVEEQKLTMISFLLYIKYVHVQNSGIPTKEQIHKNRRFNETLQNKKFHNCLNMQY